MLNEAQILMKQRRRWISAGLKKIAQCGKIRDADIPGIGQ